MLNKTDETQSIPFERISTLLSSTEFKPGKSFSEASDEMPRNRVKVVHAQGVVAKVKWVAEPGVSHDYTGLFQGDSDALLRMSEANFDVPEAKSLTPSIALKFPRDSKSSVNILANASFEPTGSFNFFENDFRVNIDMFKD